MSANSFFLLFLLSQGCKSLSNSQQDPFPQKQSILPHGSGWTPVLPDQKVEVPVFQMTVRNHAPASLCLRDPITVAGVANILGAGNFKRRKQHAMLLTLFNSVRWRARRNDLRTFLDQFVFSSRNLEAELALGIPWYVS